MDHIENMFPKRFHGHDAGYDVDYFRDRIPELQTYELSDTYVRRHRAMLLEYLRQKEICNRCTGFARCGKQGDMKGFYQVIEQTPTGINVGVSRCKPFREHMDRAQVQRIAKAIGTSELDEGFQFSNYPSDQARRYPKVLQYARTFASEFRLNDGRETQGLYLFGPPGVGKTHLMFAVFNQLRERGIPSLIVRSDSLFDQMRHMLSDGQDLEPFLETLSTVPVLGLDEFAQERANDFTMEKLFRVINHRFHAKRSTWFTSNFSPPDAYRRSGDDVNDAVAPLRSRVMSMSILVKMDGIDARQNNLKTLT